MFRERLALGGNVESKRKKKYGDKKRPSHAKNVEVWRELSGRERFSPEEQYWTMADPESIEFNSMTDLNLLKGPSQYHMVNDSEVKCELLRKNHRTVPKGNTHRGDWSAVMQRGGICPQGGIVYVDTMEEPDQVQRSLSTMLVATFSNCGPRTLICLNFCYTRPQRGHSLNPLTNFYAFVSQQLTPSLDAQWIEVGDINGCFGYDPPKTGSTQMLTLFYWRPE